jgi:ligand-binding sensor domain-containing protein
MRAGITWKTIISTFWCLFIFSIVSNGQSYRFRNYGEGKIPDTYIYTINQDNKGFLWIGTRYGLVKFDGFTFSSVSFPDSVPNQYPTVSLKDKNGKLWFGCNDGTIFYIKNSNIYKLPDLNVQSINAIFESPDGFIWIIPQDKAIIKIDENNPLEIKSYGISRDIQMTTACLAPDGKILVGTQQNLLYCNFVNDSVKVVNQVEGINYSKVQAIQPLREEGKYIVGIKSGGLYALSIKNRITALKRFTDLPDFEPLDVESIYLDPSGAIWISTNGSGLIELTLSLNEENVESKLVYDLASGLPDASVKTVFRDMEDNLWIGFWGNGLSMLSSGAFSFYEPSAKSEANNVIYINQLNDRYLLGTPSGYYLFSPKTGKSDQYINLTPQIKQNEILSYLLDESKRLWIGTKGGGLYLNNLGGGTTQFYLSGNNTEDNIYHIAKDGKNLWLSTLDGVILIDSRNGKVLKKFRTEDRLPHNSINQIFIKKDGWALVATQCDRLYSINPDSVNIGKGIMKGSFQNKVTCFTQAVNGEIWAGTAGNGVFSILNDTVMRYTAETSGLLTNYCYSIFADSDNKIWIGHERGFSRYDLKTGVTKKFENDFAKFGNCNPNAIFETKDGKLLIGTTEGLISFDRLKEKNIQNPPLDNILSVTIGDEILPYKPVYTLPYSKRYSITIDYVGINLTDPERVSYKTKLDNFDDKWVLKNERKTNYTLSDGKYRFNMMSINEDGLSQDTPVSFDLIIKKPVWRTWWFFLIWLAIVSGVVVLIIYIREKSQREMNEYLESELAERTRVVLKQKDEI